MTSTHYYFLDKNSDNIKSKHLQHFMNEKHDYFENKPF